ncbi:hypothetical protein ACFWXK_19960 [Streptomyces sp. NPDC059070]|uniref:hypothetical protein n=1 Tax=Streptomyces sp. NPDC059070 TaxID=3346713 RepID=UPI0036BACCC4
MPRTPAPHRPLTAVLLLVLGVVTVLLSGPSPAVASAPHGPVAAVSAVHDGSPGCKQREKPDKGADPAAPVRARGAHDQAPALTARPVPPASAAQDADHRTPPVRGPTRAAPTPVELSVLRV